MDGNYAVRLIEEPQPGGESTWFAEHPALPGCHAVGRTLEEAQINLERSRDAWLEWARREGVDVPPPPEQEASVTVQYSTKRDLSETRGMAAEPVEQQTIQVKKVAA